MDELRDVLVSTDLPLHGLAGFDGVRWVSRWGWSWIGLAHGEPTEPSRVEVGVLRRASTAKASREEVQSEVNVFDTLEGLLVLDRLSDLESDSAREQLAALPRAVATGERWSPRTLAVDGAADDCLFLEEDERWLAFVERSACWIYVFSVGVPSADVEISPVSDLEPYIRGTESLDQRSA